MSDMISDPSMTLLDDEILAHIGAGKLVPLLPQGSEELSGKSTADAVSALLGGESANHRAGVVQAVSGARRSYPAPHCGREGEQGGSAPREECATVSQTGSLTPEQIQSNIERLMPESNRGVLDIPASGLQDATCINLPAKYGKMKVARLAYHPKERVLLAGSSIETHWELFRNYGFAKGKMLDEWVKMWRHGDGVVEIMADRLEAKGGAITTTADAWPYVWEAVHALRSVGFSENTPVVVYWPDKSGLPPTETLGGLVSG